MAINPLIPSSSLLRLASVVVILYFYVISAELRPKYWPTVMIDNHPVVTNIVESAPKQIVQRDSQNQIIFAYAINEQTLDSPLNSMSTLTTVSFPSTKHVTFLDDELVKASLTGAVATLFGLVVQALLFHIADLDASSLSNNISNSLLPTFN